MKKPKDMFSYSSGSTEKRVCIVLFGVEQIRNLSCLQLKASGYDSEATDNEDNDSADTDLNKKLSCVICKHDTQPLIECQECRNSYHHECHKPPLNKKNFDPRSVWYCSKCNKSIGKKAVKPIVNKSVINKPASGSPVAFVPTTTAASLNYQNVQFKDTATTGTAACATSSSGGGGNGKLSNSSKLVESRTKGGSLSKFAPYSTNLKPGVSTITTANRTSAAINLVAVNKNKINTTAGHSSFTSNPATVAGATTTNTTSSLSSLDKRLPNLKKVKMNQKFNN